MSGSGIQTQPFMPTWRAKLAQVISKTGRAKVMFYGDSTFAGGYALNVAWNGDRPFAMANYIAAMFNANGIPANINNTFADQNSAAAGTSLPYDTRMVLTGLWQYANLGSNFYTPGGNFLSSNAGSAPLHFTPADPLDTIEFFYLRNAGYGKIALSIDGGGQLGAQIDCNGATQILSTTRTVPLGNHTVNVQGIGDGLNIICIGINTFNSTVPMVECWNLAIGGANASILSQSSQLYNPLPGIAAIAPDLTVFTCTINDANSVTPNLATYAANLQLIDTACGATGDVLYCPGNYIGTANGLTNQAAIIQVFKNVAQNNGRKVVNFDVVWPSFAVGNANGWYNTTNDFIHPRTTGYQVRGNTIFPYLMG